MDFNDRAWNDPPSLSYLKTKPTSSKRTLLNKRVPFPLPKDAAYETISPASPRSTEKINKDIDGPPPILPIANLPVVSSSESSNIEETNKTRNDASFEDISDEDMILHILSAFENLTSTFLNVPEKRLQDINRRIEVFKDSWKENLSFAVKKKMYLLATELSCGNFEAADKLHCSLIVDHVREVSSWMVGVKHLIKNAEEQQLVLSAKAVNSSEGTTEDISAFNSEDRTDCSL